MGWVVNATPLPLYTPGQWPGTHCIGGWVGPRASLDGWGKSRPPPGFNPRTVQPVASRYIDYTQKCRTLTKLFFFLIPHCVMIRFSSFRRNTASVFRVAMFQVGAEVILRVKCVSCLVHYSIGWSFEGVGFVLGQWELRFAKDSQRRTG